MYKQSSFVSVCLIGSVQICIFFSLNVFLFFFIFAFIQDLISFSQYIEIAVDVNAAALYCICFKGIYH